MKSVFMRSTVKLSLLALSLSFGVNTVYASENPRCDAKRQAVEKKLEYAKSAGNKYRVAGLEKALADINTYCTDANLADKAKDEVSDLQKELKEEQAELEKIKRSLMRAEASGDKKKIEKYEEKFSDQLDEIKEVETELKEAIDFLNSFKK